MNIKKQGFVPKPFSKAQGFFNFSLGNIKKIITAILSVAAIPAVLADYEYGMMGYNGGSHMGGTGIYGAILIVLGAFIFSIIFWGTYMWLVKGQNNKKTKKKK